MRRLLGLLIVGLSLLWAAPILAEEQSIVFGQIALVDGLAEPWKLVFKEIDTGKTASVSLEMRGAASALYDFAAPLTPGRYHLYMIEAPRVFVENRISEKSQYFELKAGAVLYLGNWTIKLGAGGNKTKYSVSYDVNEVGLFSKANPSIDLTRFAIGVLGKPPVPLKAN